MYYWNPKGTLTEINIRVIFCLVFDSVLTFMVQAEGLALIVTEKNQHPILLFFENFAVQ